MEFTYEAYEMLLYDLKDRGYLLIPFGKKLNLPYHRAIIRHDIDISPVKAVKIAEIEDNACVQGTYFFMLTSEFYNLLDKENEYALRKISRLGHHIGLHFDVTKYDAYSVKSLETYVIRELRILQDIVGAPVNALSWHMPDPRFVGTRLDFLEKLGIINSYDPEYIGEYKYISDSNMNWRDDPYAYMNTAVFPKLQILTHPVWYSETAMPKEDIIRSHIRCSNKKAIRYLEVISPGSFSI